ncbi:hypothetical protein TorRG33x02_192100 [Trema orientale]|uniref:Uncharacterized protein n=1 Tax=Trema orientale TaxID=63057 RepID=A0A2P5EHD1_TREOI|nr:hypothetical protein TorRG33x02_192100 [Trema orientale]
MLLGEVLRLEIAFCCPDFPVMLNNDASLDIRCQLSEIFGKELKKINLKINELKREILPRGDGSRTMNLIRERLKVGIRDIWKELDLKSGADQTN